MDVHTILGIVFVLAMALFLYLNRKSLEFQKILGPFVYFAMYRAEWGLGAMDWLAKKLPRVMKWLFYAGIVIGFAGMIFISYEIVSSSLQLFTQPTAAPGIQPVLPISVKGVFFVPFAYWILTILIVAGVHEFFHGVASRAHNIPVKSSGFAFLGVLLPIVPAAFVEPDERKLVKRPAAQQLSVFAAGPLANILLSFVLIFAFGFSFPGVSAQTSEKIALFSIPDYVNSITQWDGLKVTSVTAGSPAEKAGIISGLVITAIDGVPTTNRDALLKKLDDMKPGDQVSITFNGVTRAFITGTSPTDSTRAWIGVGFDTIQGPTPQAAALFGATGYSLLVDGVTLIVFIYALSLGIGLFNLLPLGPVDGGRMFQLVSVWAFGEKRGNAVWKYLGFFFLALIILNLTIGFVR